MLLGLSCKHNNLNNNRTKYNKLVYQQSLIRYLLFDRDTKNNLTNSIRKKNHLIIKKINIFRDDCIPIYC